MDRAVTRPTGRRRRAAQGQARLHGVVFAGGLLILLLGILGWAFQGGPETPMDVVMVLDLTAGGTLLCTGSLVGRARAAEARRSAQLGVLQQAARRMSSALDPEGVGRAVVEETGRVIDYHNARVYLLEDAGELVPVAFEGRVGAYERVDLDILRTRVGVGFTGWVAAHGTAIRVDDANADPRGMTIPGTDDVDESMLVVPMQHDGRMIGVITLSKLGLRQFDDEDLRLLTILGDQAATAFSGAYHLAEARRLAAELRQLLDMSSALTRSLDPVAVATLMADHLARAVGADKAEISDWDRPGARLRTLGCWPLEQREHAEDYYALDGFPETCRVLEERALSVTDVEDPAADPAEVALLRADGMGGLVMLPLIAKGEAIGLVELTFRGRPPADPGRIAVARTMAHEAAMALENARLYERARDLADRDPLTRFFNHRYLHERLSEEIVRSVRTRRPLSVVMLDLDDFKVVNDSFGHVYGDGVLVHVAERIRASVRASDVTARYGGDEFAIVLPETDRESAAVVAERILGALAGRPHEADGRPPFVVGASIGIATHPRDGSTATQLIAAADLGLYAAKGLGGNVAQAGGEPGSLDSAGDADPRAGSTGRQPVGRSASTLTGRTRVGAGALAGQVRSGDA